MMKNYKKLKDIELDFNEHKLPDIILISGRKFIKYIVMWNDSVCLRNKRSGDYINLNNKGEVTSYALSREIN